MLKYFSKFCSLANNLWFEYNNKQVTLCVYKQSIYTTIKSLLGGIQWNEDNCNSQEFKLVFYSIDDTKDKIKTRTLQLAITWTADFVYCKDGVEVVEDVKPSKFLLSDRFVIKEKLFFWSLKKNTRSSRPAA